MANKLNDKLQMALENLQDVAGQVMYAPADGLTIWQAADLARTFNVRTIGDKVYRFKLRHGLLSPDDPEFRPISNGKAFRDAWKDGEK